MKASQEIQDQTRLWEAGDLYQFPTGLVLCVGAGHTFAQFITAEGMPLGDIQFPDVPKNAYFLCHTGLHYTYQSREQLQHDFALGFFTPYFNRI